MSKLHYLSMTVTIAFIEVQTLQGLPILYVVIKNERICGISRMVLFVYLFSPTDTVSLNQANLYYSNILCLTVSVKLIRSGIINPHKYLYIM